MKSDKEYLESLIWELDELESKDTLTPEESTRACELAMEIDLIKQEIL